MPPPQQRTESLRAEAARRGVTVYQVRTDRAEARGISRAVAAGHAARTGERGLAPPVSVRRFFAGVESVKFRRHQGANNDQTVVMLYSTDGNLDEPTYVDDDYWSELLAWLDTDYFDIDWEEYFG